MEEIFSRIAPLPQHDVGVQPYLHLEESTIDPHSHLPSFIEICHFVQDTMTSLQDTMLLGIDGLSSNVSSTARNTTYFQKLSRLILRLIQRYKLEVLAITVFKLELECLRRCDASLSEATFGLKRVRARQREVRPIKSQVQLVPMAESDRIKSALYIATFCYLRHKLPKLWEHFKWVMNEDYTDYSSGSRSVALKRIFVKLFPFLHMTAEGLQILYFWRYLFGKSIFASPVLSALGLVVRRVALSDKISENSAESIQDQTGKNHVLDNKPIPSKNSVLVPLVGSSLGILYAGNLVFHFLRRLKYHRRQVLLTQCESNEAPRNTSPIDSMTSLIPPPKSLELSNNQRLDTVFCPLCKDDRVIPTSCSHGYVYCYRCIANYLKENNEKCPITSAYCPRSLLLQLREG